MKPKASLLCATFLCVLFAFAVPSAAQSADNVLLVTNSLSQASSAIGEYYARKRGIPNEQQLRLRLPIAEEIDRAAFQQSIQQPIAEWLVLHAAQDRILYIVLTKDIPLRITGTSGPNGSVASVDSELTLLYRRMTGVTVVPYGPVKNPYFLPDLPQATPVRFTHRLFDIFLVARLDGYSVEDVTAMIDRGSAPVREGTIVLDGKLELGVAVGNRWLLNASQAIRRLPGWSDRVEIDTGQTTLRERANVLGFYTWGSNAVMAQDRRFGHTFAPGALAAEFVSTDARTFKEPPVDWVINDTKNTFGGSHQSLIGDFIRDGVTGTAGHVAEPYLNGTIRPEALFPSYLKGFNLVESFYLAMPSLSWQTVVIGDPLCSPFASAAATTAELNPPIDDTTLMPQLFSARRVAMITSAGAKLPAATLLARADVLLIKKDETAVRELLEQATALDLAYSPAQMAVAAIYERSEEWDAAIERYRVVVEHSPTQSIALNNLAYALAIRKNQPAEALPFAVRAYGASIQDPVVGDTLAWIHHLMGNDSLAVPIMTIAARRLPQIAEVQWHAAVVFETVRDLNAARQALDAAFKLDPTLATRSDLKALQARLQTGPK